VSAEVEAIYKAIFSKPVARPLIGWRASCGFPSPAEDYIEGSLDLSQYLVKNRAATFYIRVRGDSMTGANIHPGNLLVVDRAAEAHDGHVVVARIGDELCIKRFHTVEGRVWLVAENPDYDPIEIEPWMDFEIWGRVMHSVQSFC
jgi:DNA polymerase V